MGGRSSKQKKDPNSTIVDLRDFAIKETIGRGAFGKVKIVKKKSNQVQYALKYIEKRRCIKKNSVKNIFEERALLESLIHPFLINLRYAFQDDEHMFFVMDLATGGDLRFHINTLADFDEQTLQCYSAEACLALDYLHTQKIIHRDLKPDNFLLDVDGHLHLCDFNVCYKVVDNHFPNRRAGTLVYMAPELFADVVYTYCVDYWSLGVTLYECFYRKRPFRAKDKKRLVKALNEQEIEFPEERVALLPKKNKRSKETSGMQKIQVSEEFKDFLIQLMCREATERLGGFKKPFKSAIMKHAFLKNINWEDTIDQKLIPNYKPDPKRRNFDAMYQVEDVLMEDGLAYRKPKKSQATTAMGGSGAASSMNPGNTPEEITPTTPGKVVIPIRDKDVKPDSVKWTEIMLEFIDKHFDNYNYEIRTASVDPKVQLTAEPVVTDLETEPIPISHRTLKEVPEPENSI